MQVTTLSQTTAAIANIEQQSTSLAQVQNTISTGLKVNQPSDDPASYAKISAINVAGAQLAAYSANVTSATTTLNESVTTLTNINGYLVQAQQLAEQGADSGTNSTQADRNALATQVSGIINSVLTAANTQETGKSLYAGTATGTIPFAVATTNSSGQPETIAYNGSTDSTSTIIGQNHTVNTQYVGSAVFQKTGADVFQALIGLRDDLQNTALSGPALTTAVNTQIGQLTAAQSAIQTVEGQQSGDLANLQSLATTITNAQTANQTNLGTYQSTDYASAVVRVQQDQTALSAIYAVTAQMLQPGFLNYLQTATA